MASTIPVFCFCLKRFSPRKIGPWPWPRTFGPRLHFCKLHPGQWSRCCVQWRTQDFRKGGGGGGGGPGNLRIMKTKRKISPLRISPFFCPKLGEDQKKKKKKGLQSDFVRYCAQTFCPSYKGGGGPCRNFTCYSMLIILYWRPKGGSMTPCPPPMRPWLRPWNLDKTLCDDYLYVVASISGRVDKASDTDTVKTGSIPARIKPNAIKIGIHSFLT